MHTAIQDALRRIIVWTRLKCRIHAKESPDFFFKTREVWWVHFGENVGSEQNGKGERFDRPALIVKKFGNRLLWVIPLTSGTRTGANMFPVMLMKGARPSTLILSQLRCISPKRLIHKFGRLDESSYTNVLRSLHEMLDEAP